MIHSDQFCSGVYRPLKHDGLIPRRRNWSRSGGIGRRPSSSATPFGRPRSTFLFAPVWLSMYSPPNCRNAWRSNRTVPFEPHQHLHRRGPAAVTDNPGRHPHAKTLATETMPCKKRSNGARSCHHPCIEWLREQRAANLAAHISEKELRYASIRTARPSLSGCPPPPPVLQGRGSEPVHGLMLRLQYI